MMGGFKDDMNIMSGRVEKFQDLARCEVAWPDCCNSHVREIAAEIGEVSSDYSKNKMLTVVKSFW